MGQTTCEFCQSLQQINEELEVVYPVKPLEKLPGSPFLTNYSLGHGKVSIDPEEAAELLLQRDHPKIASIGNVPYHDGSVGVTFVPPFFFSKNPKFINPDKQVKIKELVDHFKTENDSKVKEDLYEQLKSLGQEKEKKGKKIEMIATEKQVDEASYRLKKALEGDTSERQTYHALETHFNKSKEDVLILHSHKFIVPSNNAESKNINNRENDFILVNLSKGYIMVIENKFSLHNPAIGKAIEQLKAAKQNIIKSLGKEAYHWKFIGLIVGSKMEMTEHSCAQCFKWIKVGTNQLTGFLQNYSNESWEAHKSTPVYRTIAKKLLFIAQGDQNAPVTHTNLDNKTKEQIISTGVPNNIWFWSPSQLSISQAMQKQWMAFTSFYSTGKTKLLMNRAELLDAAGEKVLYIIANPTECKKKLALTLQFEQMFRGKKNINVQEIRYNPQGVDFYKSIQELLNKENCQMHLCIDEFQMIANPKTIKSNLLELNCMKAKVKSIWMVTAVFGRGFHLKYDLDIVKPKYEQMGFYTPELNCPFRNSKQVAQTGALAHNSGASGESHYRLASFLVIIAFLVAIAVCFSGGGFIGDVNLPVVTTLGMIMAGIYAWFATRQRADDAAGSNGWACVAGSAGAAGAGAAAISIAFAAYVSFGVTYAYVGAAFVFVFACLILGSYHDTLAHKYGLVEVKLDEAINLPDGKVEYLKPCDNISKAVEEVCKVIADEKSVLFLDTRIDSKDDIETEIKKYKPDTLIYSEGYNEEGTEMQKLEQDVKNWFVAPRKRKQSLLIHTPVLAMGIECDRLVCFIMKRCHKCSTIPNNADIGMSMMRAIARLIVVEVATERWVCLGCRIPGIFKYVTNIYLPSIDRLIGLGWAAIFGFRLHFVDKILTL